jgi:hypothetical protein
MPRGVWSKKDERMFKHIKSSCMRRGGSAKKCARIGGATVNKRRRSEGRTLNGMDGINPMTLTLMVPLALVSIPAFILWKIVK